MSKPSLAQRLAVAGTLPRLDSRTRSPIRVGLLAPLSGSEEAWGRPGLQGCEIWADWINATGGLLVGGRRHRVEVVARDAALGAARALAGARELVEAERARIVMMLGGDTFHPSIGAYLTERKVLGSIHLPSDLSPDTPYLIAPVEVHPLYNVTGVEWLAGRLRPGARVALCSQTDRTGLPSLATYRAAFEAAGLPVAREVLYPPATTDAAGIVAALMAERPDVLCWCTSAPPMVEALTEAAHAAGFAGHILSCTGDAYRRLVARTSAAFMDRFVFQFPDFDDPALSQKAFFFRQPKAFFDSYDARFPGSWSAVSWEYAAVLDIWYAAVQRADTTEPVSVLAAMRHPGRINQAFGPAEWWGSQLFGLDNALVGTWPVVAVRSGKARIVAFGSVLGWLQRHGDLLARHMEALGQLWHQRHDAGARRVRSPEGGSSGPRSARAS